MNPRTATTRIPRRQTLRQRGADATRDLRETVHLPTNPRDVTVLGTALAEAAAQEAKLNARFASEIRRRYEELMTLQRTTGSKQKRQEDLPPLIPLPRTELHERRLSVDPFAPPDPDFLIRVYGSHQLARALHDYSVDALKDSAARLEKAYPGTKPTNRGRREALIAYIVKYST